MLCGPVGLARAATRGVRDPFTDVCTRHTNPFPASHPPELAPVVREGGFLKRDETRIGRCVT